jgi:mxaJ protein
MAMPLAAGAVFVLAAGAPRRQSDELRVCVDPYDMPLSNDREEGFENKIAHVVASDLNARVVNFWWPQRRGFLRSSILAGLCDVMIQAPVGLDPVATTKPYFRSTYYFVYRSDRGLAIRSLDDTLLKHLRIGVNLIGYDYTNTPPAHALGPRGIIGLVGFGSFFNPDPKADHP